MKNTFITATVVLLIAFALATAAYFITCIDWVETVAISLGITSYHFVMRLLVGFFWNSALHNRADWNKRWFRERKFEPRLYKLLRVKSWKKYMPTLVSSFFDMKERTLPEIIGATCQAELVHETIIVLSFLPIILSSCFGALAVFIITSVLSALVDLVFVIMQRYNRPRLVRLAEKSGNRSPKTMPAE